jgi:hypothetical protein
MELREEIRDLVTRAGGIFNGIWETPGGRFVTPVAGISLSSVRSALDRVRRGFESQR